MELGEKLRLARQEAGLSQRQLCEGIVTRNMLSLIEHGSAKPSMETLRLLAARLGKPMGFFLEEEAVLSANTQVMEDARRAFDAGDPAGAVRALEGFREPDPVYGREKALLQVLALLALAEEALEQGRVPYARELLERSEIPCAYCGEELKRRRLLLDSRAWGRPVAALLPSLDEELLVRGEEALRSGDPERAGQLLDAARDRTGGRWNLLRGRAYLEGKDFRAAARCLHGAEEAYPREAVPLLEVCYREMEDFRRAYEYACRGR